MPSGFRTGFGGPRKAGSRLTPLSSGVPAPPPVDPMGPPGAWNNASSAPPPMFGSRPGPGRQKAGGLNMPTYDRAASWYNSPYSRPPAPTPPRPTPGYGGRPPGHGNTGDYMPQISFRDYTGPVTRDMWNRGYQSPPAPPPGGGGNSKDMIRFPGLEYIFGRGPVEEGGIRGGRAGVRALKGGEGVGGWAGGKIPYTTPGGGGLIPAVPHPPYAPPHFPPLRRTYPWDSGNPFINWRQP